jgi:hypothetical protein
MAAWQFVVCLVPSAWARHCAYSGTSLFADGHFDTSTAFDAFVPSSPLEDALSELLPRAKSWSTDIQRWGDAETADIQLISDGKAIREIKIRFELREPIVAFARQVEVAADRLDCCLFVPELGRVLPVTPGCIVAIARKSRAALFVATPKENLRHAGSET